MTYRPTKIEDIKKPYPISQGMGGNQIWIFEPVEIPYFDSEGKVKYKTFNWAGSRFSSQNPALIMYNDAVSLLDAYLVITGKESGRQRRMSIAQAKMAQAAAQLEATQTEIALREQTHNSAIAQQQAITSQVDYYRSKVGLTGDVGENVLAKLYGTQRDTAVQILEEAKDEEQVERDIADQGKIPWGWILGGSTLLIGGIVLFKKAK